MAYQRKTRDYWSIQQYTGQQYGWEEVNTEDTWKDAKRSLAEYRDNQPEYEVRARRKRERIECKHGMTFQVNGACTMCRDEAAA